LHYLEEANAGFTEPSEEVNAAESNFVASESGERSVVKSDKV